MSSQPATYVERRRVSRWVVVADVVLAAALGFVSFCLVVGAVGSFLLAVPVAAAAGYGSGFGLGRRGRLGCAAVAVVVAMVWMVLVFVVVLGFGQGFSAID